MHARILASKPTDVVNLGIMMDYLYLQRKLAVLLYQLATHSHSSFQLTPMCEIEGGEVEQAAIMYWVDSGYAEMFRTWLDKQDTSKTIIVSNLVALKEIINEIQGNQCDCSKHHS